MSSTQRIQHAEVTFTFEDGTEVKAFVPAGDQPAPRWGASNSHLAATGDPVDALKQAIDAENALVLR